jgi:hypothetical protein
MLSPDTASQDLMQLPNSGFSFDGDREVRGLILTCAAPFGGRVFGTGVVARLATGVFATLRLCAMWDFTRCP